ncbi:hypothetical protein BLOT_012109 [Blomia tropicalis]|nr:hypothetical protein BLOT_012109 [Blomia tropicalis]
MNQNIPLRIILASMTKTVDQLFYLGSFCLILLQPLDHRSNHHQLIVAGQFPIISYIAYTLQYITT